MFLSNFFISPLKNTREPQLDVNLDYRYGSINSIKLVAEGNGYLNILNTPNMSAISSLYGTSLRFDITSWNSIVVKNIYLGTGKK